MSTSYSPSPTPHKRETISLPNSGSLAERRVDLLDLGDASTKALAQCVLKVTSADLYFEFSDDINNDVKDTYNAASAAEKARLPVMWGSVDGVLWPLDVKYGRYISFYDPAGDSINQIQSVK